MHTQPKEQQSACLDNGRDSDVGSDQFAQQGRLAGCPVPGLMRKDGCTTDIDVSVASDAAARTPANALQHIFKKETTEMQVCGD